MQPAVTGRDSRVSQRARSIAVVSPTCGMPRPLRTRAVGGGAGRWIACVEVLRALPGEAVERLQVLDRQAVEVGRASDQPRSRSWRGRPSRRPRCPSRRARRSARTPATPGPGRRGSGSSGGPRPRRGRGRPAHRAGVGHVELALVAGPPLDERPDDLRDDVTGLLEDDPIADPDVLATDLVEVVQGRPGDRDPGHLRRPEVGDGRQRPRPPDVRHDVLDDRLDLLRAGTCRRSPSAAPGRPCRGAPAGRPVDLDDDAVGLVRELVAPLPPALGEGDDGLDVEIVGAIRVDRKAQALQPVEGGRLLGRRPVAVLEELVEPGRQLAAGGHLRVVLAQRARAAVARVGVERQPGLLALGVDPRELRPRHEHLAPDIGRGGLREPLRDDADRPQVGRHVLAGRAVTARRALDEPAALVAQRDGQSIDLELGDVAQVRCGLRGRRQAQAAPDASVEGAQLVVREGVRQRQHRAAVANLVEGAGRGAADALGG